MRIIYTLAFFHFFFFSVSKLSSQQLSHFQKQAILVKRVIERNHFNPKTVDDIFSAQLFDRFLERMDEEKIFLFKADIKELSTWRNNLDNELNGSPWIFFTRFTTLYKLRLEKADSLLTVILQKPFDLNKKEIISFSKDSMHYAADEKEYQLRWYRKLKYEMLVKLRDAVMDRKGTQGISSQPGSTDESEARKLVQAALHRNILNLLQNPRGYENYIADLFCDIIATTFDPHSSYFAPDARDNFNSALSSEGLYYGFSIGEADKGELEIAGIIPGSAAWKTGELNTGDQLLKMTFGDKAPVDLKGAERTEVLALMDAAGNVPLQLTVKKANGLIRTVSLVKTKVHNEDGLVKGFVLNNGTNIGYIALPGFYSNEENESGSSCANDVAREIINLKKENIGGLILDLRYNGGGSMKEALEMAGIFIDEGPLVVYAEHDRKLHTLRDPNRGTIFDGPLLVLVNGQSASASELLSAVLQDYNRAIIIGGNTYGKGTFQAVLPLDTTVDIKSGNVSGQTAEYGYAKVTEGKFYRLTGKTVQLQGVKADISLPDIFDSLKYREVNNDFALAADTVKRNAYFKPLPFLPSAELALKSASRVKGSKTFSLISTISGVIAANAASEKGNIPLQWEYFQKMKERMANIVAREAEIDVFPVNTWYSVDNLAVEKQTLAGDTYATEINAKIIKKIQRDAYIGEAVNVLNDLKKSVNSK